MNFKIIFIATAIVALAACGGGRKAPANTNANAAASPAAYGQSKGAAAMGTAEPVPSLNCGGTQPVWVNERSRVFHMAGDPYYGRTKHGKYMCERDAAKAGYHPSKM
jgi:hypothetical protein